MMGLGSPLIPTGPHPNPVLPDVSLLCSLASHLFIPLSLGWHSDGAYLILGDLCVIKSQVSWEKDKSIRTIQHQGGKEKMGHLFCFFLISQIQTLKG